MTHTLLPQDRSSHTRSKHRTSRGATPAEAVFNQSIMFKSLGFGVMTVHDPLHNIETMPHLDTDHLDNYAGNF